MDSQQPDEDCLIERVFAGSEHHTHTITLKRDGDRDPEARHALITSLIPEADKVHKVKIDPRDRRTNANERSKGKVELDSLLRWEDEGGQIAHHVDERGEVSVSQGYSIKLERSPENASV